MHCITQEVIFNEKYGRVCKQTDKQTNSVHIIITDSRLVQPSFNFLNLFNAAEEINLQYQLHYYLEENDRHCFTLHLPAGRKHITRHGFVWQRRLSQQPRLSDTMCTAATRVSPPISMHLLSACPSCLVLEGWSWLLGLFVCCCGVRLCSSVNHFVLKKAICRADVLMTCRKHAHVHVQCVCTHRPNSCVQTFSQNSLNLSLTHSPTHILSSLWAIGINEVHPSSLWPTWRCHPWCQDCNRWKHYTNCPVKQRGGSAPPCSFAVKNRRRRKKAAS